MRCAGKSWLHSLIPRIEARLETLGLILHPRKRNVFPVSEGCDFMGYRIWPTHRRIQPMNGFRFRRRFKLMAEDFKVGKTNLEEIRSRIMSWMGNARHADTWGLRTAIFKQFDFSGG